MSPANRRRVMAETGLTVHVCYIGNVKHFSCRMCLDSAAAKLDQFMPPSFITASANDNGACKIVFCRESIEPCRCQGFSRRIISFDVCIPLIVEADGVAETRIVLLIKTLKDLKLNLIRTFEAEI